MKPPARQENYELSRAHAFTRLREMEESALTALGVERAGPGVFQLKVLDGLLRIDLKEGVVHPAAPQADAAPIEWQILALHYLGAAEPRKEFSRWLSFAEMPEGRGYLPVFNKRVIGRLCATAGRDRESFGKAAEKLGGRKLEYGDAGYVFQAFPFLPVAIAWYAGDEELPPGASFLYPDNVSTFFSVEDAVVLAEALVSRLQRA